MFFYGNCRHNCYGNKISVYCLGAFGNFKFENVYVITIAMKYNLRLLKSNTSCDSLFIQWNKAKDCY